MSTTEIPFEVKETTLIDYIKSRKFEDFQLDCLLENEDLLPFKDELFGAGDKFDDLFCLKDVFLLQKAFYEHTGVYLVFPIAGKFIYEQATRADCSWCSIYTYEGFDTYLAELINNYEKQ